jgi:hypothetical protein
MQGLRRQEKQQQQLALLCLGASACLHQEAGEQQWSQHLAATLQNTAVVATQMLRLRKVSRQMMMMRLQEPLAGVRAALGTASAVAPASAGTARAGSD